MIRLTNDHAKLVVEPIETSGSMRSSLVSFSAGYLPAILESSRITNTYGRYSVLSCDPASVVTIASDASRDVDVIGELQNAFSRWPALANTHKELPLAVGWIGYLSYEAGLPLAGISQHRISQDIESCGLKSAAQNTPAGAVLAQFCLYDHAAIFDAWQQRWFAVAVDWPANTPEPRPSVASRLAAIRELLNQNSDSFNNHTTQIYKRPDDEAAKDSELLFHRAKRSSLPSPLTKGGLRGVSSNLKERTASTKPRYENDAFPSDDSSGLTIAASMTRQQYFQQFTKAMSYIEAGDIYEVNLAIRFDTETSLSPIEQYLKLRESSPSTHAAFLPWDDGAIISTSPELFLELRDGRVTTRPIKGTRARADDPAIDEMNRQDLTRSEKDRAELNMIVDLMRNDLGRVCEYGSIRVIEAAALEALPTVFQQVATIEGRLSQQYAWPDLLRASFPGGSITGAPKIRAMQIIEELEPTAREVYCGSIGIIGLDGSMSLNIAIRTMVQRRERVKFWAGSAIVADSDPQAEYDEILAKTVGLRRALIGMKPQVSALA